MNRKYYFLAGIILTGLCLISPVGSFAEEDDAITGQTQTMEPARKIRSRIDMAKKNKMELSEDGRTLLRITEPDRKNVTIPKGVTEIGDRVFENCERLRKVTIPDTVTTIGARAFRSCIELKNIMLPDSVIRIRANAFQKSGIKRLVLPENITEIPEQMCSNCSNLERVTIPEGVTSIGARAFLFCGKLQEITIPASVTSIGAEAFSGTPLKVMPKNSVFYADKTGVLFDKTEKKLLIAPATLSRRYKIPDGIEKIETEAFRYCGKNLSHIEIPASVIEIGDAAFESVGEVKLLPGNTVFKLDESGVLIDTVQQKIIFAPPALKDEYVVPDGILYIGIKAFQDCKELTGVKLPEGLLGIGRRAFYNCGKLRYIDLPDSVTYIGTFAFAHCKGLRNMKLPSNLETLQIEIFGQCTGLTEITIHANVKKVFLNAFKGSGVSEIFIPDHVEQVYGGVLLGTDRLKLISLPNHIPASEVKKDCLPAGCKVVWRKKEKTESQE